LEIIKKGKHCEKNKYDCDFIGVHYHG
jgi:hypothetical protein